MPNTASPKWNDQEWFVRNIPSTAKLSITVYDKDDKKPKDDYVGKFEILNVMNYEAPPDGHVILGHLNRSCGRFHLSIDAVKSDSESQKFPHYTNDSRCRYSRHDDIVVGKFTKLNDDRVYSTFEIQLRRIPYFFRQHELQYWNQDYKSANMIFGKHPTALTTKNAIKLAHRVLYGRTVKYNEDGIINNADDLWKLVFIDRKTQRIKPCVYTYMIDDNSWRFSETGHKVFTDFASKHALLANGSEYVRCAGEFHPRPKFGWNRCDHEWELVFDNGSGTYAPGENLLEIVKELLLFNFHGLNIVTYHHQDPLLKESLKQLKMAAEN